MKRLARNLKCLLYLLPLFAITFIAQTSYAANTSYDGETLYKSYCAACHDNGTGGAQKIAGVAGRGDDITITKNAITNNKSRTGVTTNMSPYSFLTDTQLQGIVNYTYPSSADAVDAMPVPTVPASIPSYTHIETPVIANNSTIVAYPIGAGNINGGFLNWQVGLPAFSGPVDILVAFQLGSTILTLNSQNALTSTMSIWKTVSGSKLNESITETLGISGGNLSMASLPKGTYTLYLAVFPAGNFSANNLNAFYLWATQFTN